MNRHLRFILMLQAEGGAAGVPGNMALPKQPDHLSQRANSTAILPSDRQFPFVGGLREMRKNFAEGLFRPVWQHDWDGRCLNGSDRLVVSLRRIGVSAVRSGP